MSNMETVKKQITPIMYAYGLAVFEGQNLEHGLGHLLRIIDHERKKEGLEPLNADIDDPYSYKTIGQLFNKVKAVECLSQKEINIIKRGIKDRNLLVHSYWLEKNVEAILTPAGRRRILKDLDYRRESCRQADRLVTKFIDAYLAKYGTSISALAQSLEWINDEAPFHKNIH
jgi:hypothetical protein